MRKNVFVKAVALIMMLIMVFPIAACSKDQAKDIGEGIAEGVVGVLKDADGNAVNVYEGVKCTTEANKNMLTDYTAFKSEGSYYFVFCGGKVFNTALDNGVKKIWQGIGESTITFQLVETTEETLESATSKAIENTNMVENNFSIDYTKGSEVSISAGFEMYGFSAGASAKATVEIGLGYQKKWGFSETSTISESFRKCVASSKEETTIKDFTFNKECPKGNYYYILLGDIEVYNVVVVNPIEKTTKVGMFSTILRSEKQMIYVGEAEEYDATPNEKLKFELSEVENIINSAIVNDKNIVDITKVINQSVIAVPQDRYMIANDKNYDITKKIEDKAHLAAHEKFVLGEILLYGCDVSGDNYIIKDINSFSIKYHITEDPQYLPYNQEIKKVDYNYLTSDSAKKVHGTNIQNEKIGKGAYWIRITFNDNQQIQLKETDFMNGASKGSYIEMVEFSEINKKGLYVNKIEIVIVYETKFGADNTVLFFDWSDYSNNRVESTITFINA